MGLYHILFGNIRRQQSQCVSHNTMCLCTEGLGVSPQCKVFGLIERLKKMVFKLLILQFNDSMPREALLYVLMVPCKGYVVMFVVHQH